MDKERNPSGQVDPKEGLLREMERTRQSMSQTVDDMKGEISQAFEWQTYLRRYPGALLIGSGALGFIIGRAITTSGKCRKLKDVHEQTPAFDGNRERSSRPSHEDSNIRRVVDMTASALLAQVVPIVSSKVRSLLGIHPAGGGSGESRQQDSWLH